MGLIPIEVNEIHDCVWWPKRVSYGFFFYWAGAPKMDIIHLHLLEGRMMTMVAELKLNEFLAVLFRHYVKPMMDGMTIKWYLAQWVMIGRLYSWPSNDIRNNQSLKGAVVVTLCQNEAEVEFQMDNHHHISPTKCRGHETDPGKTTTSYVWVRCPFVILLLPHSGRASLLLLISDRSSAKDVPSHGAA